MNRLNMTAAALLVLALATPGCARNRNLPTQLAPSRITTIGVNAYLWRAALDTVSFAPLLQANAEQRRDHHRLVCQSARRPASGSSSPSRSSIRTSAPMRCASPPRAGQPERRLGRRAGHRGDGPEARGHHPDEGPRPAPFLSPGISSVT